MENTIAVLRTQDGTPVVPSLDVRREHAMNINIPAMPHVVPNGDKWTTQTTHHFSREYRTHWEQALMALEEVFPNARFSMAFDSFTMTVSVPKKSWDVDWELRSVWTALYLCNPETPYVIHRGPLTPHKIALATSEVMYGGDPKEVFRS